MQYPSNFAGSSTGIDVTLNPGIFNVTETIPAGSFFTTSFTGDCDGMYTRQVNI